MNTLRNWVLAGLLIGVGVGSSFASDKLSFNRDVRLILSDNCFTCHGPDAGQRQAGLRLDVRELALQSADSGETAIVPGDPAASELVRRIASDDADLQMPPADSGKSLSAEQIDVLRRWVGEGAEYEAHWAFIPPVRPEPPEVTRLLTSRDIAKGLPPHVATWPRNSIDNFILARLLQAGLAPSPEADKATLIRRVTLDLTGLPPTLAEVDAFLADDSPHAYERVVDRLLMSPHYGERMAIPWLDAARYADSNGFQSDGSRDMWSWRDWVITAFNRNLPFDQFTIEQLAGDMLPEPTRDQIIATGFNRNHRLNGEGGRIVEEWFVETVIDRVETTGLTWLGLTVNCCRCHDHKYDPITQKEFYQLFAFFNSVDETGVLDPEGKNGTNTAPTLAVPTPEQQAELDRLAAELVTAERKVAEAEKELLPFIAEWEATARESLDDKAQTWQRLNPTRVVSRGGATLARQDDSSYLASGKNPNNDEYEISGPIDSSAISGLLLEVLPDPSLPNQSLGRGSNGNFVLTDVEATITAPSLEKPVEMNFVNGEADYEQSGWTAQSVVDNKPRRGSDGKNRQGWAVDGNAPDKRLPRRIMFVADAAVPLPADAVLTIRLRHDSQFADHNVGRFRLSISSLEPGSIRLDGESAMPEAVRVALKLDSDARTPAQRDALEKYFRDHVDNPVKRALAEVATIKTARETIESSFVTTMVMRERNQPREAFVLNRGEYDRPGEKIERGLPAALPPMPAGAPMNRLGLARWIVDPSNPLTARVWVNRAWEQLFGIGLVKTSENFGLQSEFPSHPDLLDWLACEFMQPTESPAVAGEPAKPWDMKAFHKLLVMSATYRQASSIRPDSPAVRFDPENRLLSHGPRFRLTGELIRDQALAASGLLVPTIGGPSVRPYMPEGVWDETSRYGNLRNYKHDKGDGLYRRTLYTIWKRTAAPPTMLLFDAPNREVCTVNRSRTNTPLQALSLLNEITFVEAARKLGERMIVDGGSTVDDRLAHGFRLCVARWPTERELAMLRDGFESDLARFHTDVALAKQLVAVGESPATDSIDAAELAAYTLTANVLLNLDEFLTRE